MNREPIKEFKGEYRFLSNFYGVTVEFEGVLYPSSEHAYMAAKVIEPNIRDMIRLCATPADAKKLGRSVPLRAGWDQMKYEVMVTILRSKFSGSHMQALLLATGDRELIEGNWWNDKIWGVCLKTNVGQNLLGTALMQIRTELSNPSEEDMSQQCKCKRGHCSKIDGKCSNCRSKREQQVWLNRPSRELKITVVNKHHGTQGEYIGRGSPLGNLWPIDNTIGDTREVVIARYERWLEEQIQNKTPMVINELNRLGNLALQGPLNLQCFCCPQACHGDVIKRFLFDAISVAYPDTHWWIS